MIDLIRIVIYISIFLGLFTISFYLLGFLHQKKQNKKNKRAYSVSIIIPAYNEQATLKKTVKSTLALNYPKNKLEILIINDGSTDKTEEIARALEKEYLNVKTFSKKNGGKGSALNFGIKKARGELIVSLDADSMVEPDALIRMIPYFEDKEVMCVTPALKIHKPRNILQRIQATEYDLGIFLRKAFSKLNAIHVTPGPFSAYRKSFFEKHGYYDEKNITEDMEIGMRIQSLNYKIENSMDSVVYTLSPNKLSSLTRQRRRWYFGMIKNLWDYRRILGAKYGELGLVILPVGILSIFIILLMTLYHASKAVLKWSEQLRLYSSIGFDFIHNTPLLWDLFILTSSKIFSENFTFFAIFFILITLTILFVTNKKISSKENPLSTFINYLFFLIFYSVLFSFWWIISGIYYIAKREVKW